jgi:predicted TIM-barrel fold metal-dependent hydrolase
MDPRHPRARRRLKQYRERGVRVIKLLPCLGYQPDAPKWRRFFRTMEDEGHVVMVHTGFITARHKREERRAGVYLNSRYGRPVYFDELARRHPGIQFILCHMGGALWMREAVEMVNQHENVWGDVSGSGIAALRQVGREKLTVKWEKLFWGNDSAASAYPYNLHLLMHTLRETGLTGMAPGLLRQNGKKFIETYLS